MSIGAIGSPYTTPEATQKPQKSEELTTVTTQCKEKHNHDQSCPHTVSTKPAPTIGESGHLLDERA